MPHIDGIWPQLYWDTFNNQPNIDAYRFSGYPPPGAGVTPEFLLDTTYRLLSGYDRQVIPMGQGATADPATWPRFQQRAWQLGWGEVGVWRYGVTPLGTIQYLGQHPAGNAPPSSVPQTTPTSTPPATPTRPATATRTATPRPPTATFTPPPISTPPPAGTSAP